jgi:hypothetical protein
MQKHSSVAQGVFVRHLMQPCTSAASEERSPHGPPPECGALLRIELARIDQTATKPIVQRDRVCPAGMELVEHEGCQTIMEAEGGLEGVEPASDSRFVLSVGMVFDTTTGLTWQQEPAPFPMTWEAAKRYCLALAVDGAGGWRLPRKKELSTLVDRTRPSPKIDVQAFPSAPAASFWTLSPDTSSPGDAWAVDFHLGKAESRGSGSRLHVRCVR